MLKKLVVVLLPVCLVISLVGCSDEGENVPTPTPLPQVVNTEKVVFKVERGSIISERDVAAEIVPAKQDKLSFSASGNVSRVLVKNGDLVKKGDVLAELQLDDLLDQLQQARIDLEISRANYATEKLQRAYDVQQAESEVVIWQAQVQMAKNRLEMSVGAQKDDDQLNLEIAQEKLKTAQAWLALVRGKANSEIDQVVKRNQFSVDRLERLVVERQVIAPYDGIVLFCPFIPGIQAEAYTNAILLGDPTNLVVQVSWDYELINTVDSSTVAYLYINKTKDPKYPVKFIPDFLPISNKKEGISTQGDTISLNYLFFSVPEDLPREQIPVGSRVNLLVVLGDKKDALLLPPPAIRGNQEFKYVIVLEDDYHRRVEVVQIGVKTSDKWEIVGNLKEGDLVLGP